MKKSLPVIISVLLVAVLLIVGGCTTTTTITATTTTTAITTTTATTTTTTTPTGAAPKISFTSPSESETGVHLNDLITATFTENMDPSTINTQTFSVWQGTMPIDGHVHYSGKTAIFHASVDLVTNQAYTAKITTGVKSATGVSMASNYEWIFTTSGVIDILAPRVSGTIPALVATDDPNSSNASFATNNKIVATFTDQLDPETINTDTFILRKGTTAVAGTVSYDGIHSIIFDPAVDLTADTLYTATVTTGITDSAGNPLVEDFSWSFWTGPSPHPPTHLPSVVATYPANGGSTYSNNSITVTFNEPICPLCINNNTFTLLRGTTSISGTVAFDGLSTAIFTPSNPLNVGATYTAVLTTDIIDLAGNHLSPAYSWNFTVVTAQNHIPEVVFYSPAIGATNVSKNTVINITFSEEMDPSSISVSLMRGTTDVLGSWTLSNNLRTVTFTPASPLAPNTLYSFYTSAKDLAYFWLIEEAWSFTTGP